MVIVAVNKKLDLGLGVYEISSLAFVAGVFIFRQSVVDAEKEKNA